VQLRELLASNTALARKLNELEGKLKPTGDCRILCAIETHEPPAAQAPAIRLHR